jgi:hypothetical protein
MAPRAVLARLDHYLRRFGKASIILLKDFGEYGKYGNCHFKAFCEFGKFGDCKIKTNNFMYTMI